MLQPSTDFQYRQFFRLEYPGETFFLRRLGKAEARQSVGFLPTCHVLADDYIIIAGDINGHVGEKADGNRYHGRKGFVTRIEGGERIINFASTHDLVLMNTGFIKRLSHLPAFYSGNSKTQIDYILIRRRHFTTVTVPYETIAPHR